MRSTRGKRRARSRPAPELSANCMPTCCGDTRNCSTRSSPPLPEAWGKRGHFHRLVGGHAKHRVSDAITSDLCCFEVFVGVSRGFCKHTMLLKRRDKPSPRRLLNVLSDPLPVRSHSSER